MNTSAGNLELNCSVDSMEEGVISPHCDRDCEEYPTEVRKTSGNGKRKLLDNEHDPTNPNLKETMLRKKKKKQKNKK